MVDKSETFMHATNMLEKARLDMEQKKKYVSNMSNWICVHATNYMPQQNARGNYFIQTTAMATDNDIARASVHVTLNQIVHSHMAGNWDSVPFIILAPYNDVVEMNGNPSMVASEDTYFIPNPDTGLILPKNACIVKPNNDTLFTVGEHVSTYKTGNYTEQEIKNILSLMPQHASERAEYIKYDRGEIKEHELRSIFFTDKKLEQKYEQATDKNIVVREICEQRKIAILTKCLRDAVAVMTMEKMGYKYVLSHEDSVSRQFAETARDSHIPSNSGRTAHSCSLEKVLEANSKRLSDTLSVLKMGDLDDIYNAITYEGADSYGGSDPRLVNKFIRKNILGEKTVGFYDMYVELFQKWNGERKTYVGIKDYNPRLNIVMHRNAEKMNVQYAEIIKTLKQNPKFAELKKRLEYFEQQVDINEFGISDEELANFDNPFIGTDSSDVSNDVFHMFEIAKNTQNS